MAAVCNMDCLNCIYSDCINDDLTPQDILEQNSRDTYALGSRKYGRGITVWRYEHSEIGIEKRKERQRRYDKSEKGKARYKRRLEKRIESGKNAEYCRRYRERKKAELACM